MLIIVFLILMVDGVIYMLPTPSSSTTQEIPREKKK